MGSHPAAAPIALGEPVERGGDQRGGSLAEGIADRGDHGNVAHAKRFFKTARRFRTFSIAVGEHTITAVDLVPDNLAQAIDAIKDRSDAHQIGRTQVLDLLAGPSP